MQGGRSTGWPGKPLLAARPGQPTVDLIYVSWHNIQVFKGVAHDRESAARLCP
jgi:hypothetical protein